MRTPYQINHPSKHDDYYINDKDGVMQAVAASLAIANEIVNALNNRATLEARLAEAEQLLLDAVELIKQWHNMDTAGILTKKEHEMTWNLYRDNAPEMKAIVAFLASTGHNT